MRCCYSWASAMEAASPRQPVEAPRLEFNAGVDAFLAKHGTQCKTFSQFLNLFADWVGDASHTHGAPILGTALRHLSAAERLELGGLLRLSDCSSASSLSSILRNQHLRTGFCSLAQLVSEKVLMVVDRGGKATCDEMLYALLCQLRDGLEEAAEEFATQGVGLADLSEQRDRGPAYIDLVAWLNSKGVSMKELAQICRLEGRRS